MQKRRVNVSLWVGAVLVMLLIVLGIIGPYIAPYDLEHQEKVRNVEVNGKTVIISPPLSPQASTGLAPTNGAMIC